MGQQDPERDGKSNLYGPDERIHAKLDQKIILERASKRNGRGKEGVKSVRITGATKTTRVEVVAADAL